MVKNNQLLKRSDNGLNPFNRTEFVSSIDRIFDDFFNSEFPSLTDTFGVNMFEKHSYPKVDIYHNDKEVTIESEIPGLTKSDLKIKLRDGVLSICGNKRIKNEEKDENRKYLYKELKNSSFCRSFNINDDKIDSDKISSKFEDGLLKITLPYKEKISEKENEIEIEIK